MTAAEHSQLSRDRTDAASGETRRRSIANTLLQPLQLKKAVCRVCGHDGLQHHIMAREMMYGTRETFEYFQCENCGCLQISSVPHDLARHYRTDYYSLSADHTEPYRNKLKNALNRLRDQITLFAPYGDDMPFKVKVPHLAESFSALRRVTGLALDSRILDVGCGSGQLLHRLANAGFRNLTGIDPFVAASREFSPQLKILKTELAAVDGQYDLILLNHSFEHLSEPIGAARRIAELLAPGGTILLRIPVVDSVAWKLYGADWFQLDAPRHLYLHSRHSIAHVAAQAGLTVAAVHHDSDHHQFQISERFRADVPTILEPEERQKLRPIAPTKVQTNAWRDMAAAVNALGLGDQACFYLRRL